MSDFPLLTGSYMFSGTIDSGHSSGTIVTSSSSANTLGSIVEIDASTEAACSLMSISFAEYVPISTQPMEWLVNFYVGASGSEELILEGVKFWCDQSATYWHAQHYQFPLRIPAGSRISMDCQNNFAAADAVYIVVHFYVPSFDSFQGYGEIVSIGMDTSTSLSTILPDAGGSSNTKGAWVEIEASSVGFAGFTLSMGMNGNTATSNCEFLHDIAIGSAGNEEVIAANIASQTTGTEHGGSDGMFHPIKIPAGERTSIRSQTNLTSDTVRDVVFHGAK